MHYESELNRISQLEKQILDFIPKVQELENKNEMYEIQLKTINNILDKKEQLI